MATQRHRITGGGGVELNVVETGNPSGPSILFIHGYCQSTYAWRKQLASDLANDFRLVAFDLRGHGESGKPLDPAAYSDGGLWAGDVAAVIADLRLLRVVLVGWSYGGFVVADYLRHHGQRGIAAVDFAGCRLSMGGRGFVGERYSQLFPALFASDSATLVPAMEAFTDLCVATPLPGDERRAILDAAVAVPAEVRSAMMRRPTVNNDDILAAISIPVLVTHGADDAVVLPISGEHTASLTPGAQLSVYPGAGHSTFAENPERFNRELRELAGRAP